MCSGPLLIELNFLVLTCDAPAFPPEQNSLGPELRLGAPGTRSKGGTCSGRREGQLPSSLELSGSDAHNETRDSPTESDR